MDAGCPGSPGFSAVHDSWPFDPGKFSNKVAVGPPPSGTHWKGPPVRDCANLLNSFPCSFVIASTTDFRLMLIRRIGMNNACRDGLLLENK